MDKILSLMLFIISLSLLNAGIVNGSPTDSGKRIKVKPVLINCDITEVRQKKSRTINYRTNEKILYRFSVMNIILAWPKRHRKIPVIQ